MPIEFHCEHCNKLVKAPETAGGSRGKCPYCDGTCYVPLPPEELEELPLVPLDAADEQHQADDREEAARVQRALLADREEPVDSGHGGAASHTASTPPVSFGNNDSGDDAKSLVLAYIQAMSEGKLQLADRAIARIAGMRPQAEAVIDQIASRRLPESEMPALPKPVLVGFLKQLRSRL